MTKSIKDKTKATQLQGEIFMKRVDSFEDDTILLSDQCNGSEMVISDIINGIDFNKACKKEINSVVDAQCPKNSLVKGLDDGKRGPYFKGKPSNGEIRSVNESVVLENNGETW